jgi:RNA polymerase sigma-70 factor (ECF subfamily)
MRIAMPAAWIGELAQQHLDAAYNLGRWLLGNEQDASDAVHDAYLRAARSAHTYAGGNARAWWLAIVRNCCLALLATRNKQRGNIAIDQSATEADRASAETWAPRSDANEIEDRLDSARFRARVEQQLQRLPAEFREVVILREIEELSYREIADIVQVPIGTVMSRLARGRALLHQALTAGSASEETHGL